MHIDLSDMMRVAVEYATQKVLSDRERAEREEKAIGAIRASLPGVPLYKTYVDEVLLVFRPPTQELWTDAETAHARGVTDYTLVLNLVRGCVLHPSWSEVEDLAEHRPALLKKLAGECIKLAGLDDGLNFRRVR